ncbi:MAG TPA: VOC family protein [Chloroflexota bacterium]|nr:VOC family protein [Chloroflexota bacterium]
MGIQKLGHVGIYARDLTAMRDFYRDIVGLEITDESPRAVFMSSDPEREHHEFVMFQATDPDQHTSVQQISFSCAALEDVVAYYHRFKDAGVRFRSVTSHGNAVGLYFYDPEDNVCEVYWTTPWKAHQPYAVAVDVTKDLEEVKRLIAADVEEYGPLGHADPESFARQKQQLAADGVRV